MSYAQVATAGRHHRRRPNLLLFRPQRHRQVGRSALVCCCKRPLAERGGRRGGCGRVVCYSPRWMAKCRRCAHDERVELSNGSIALLSHVRMVVNACATLVCVHSGAPCTRAVRVARQCRQVFVAPLPRLLAHASRSSWLPLPGLAHLHKRANGVAHSFSGGGRAHRRRQHI